MVKKMILGMEVDVYEPVTLVRKVVGYGLIGWGVLSLPLPTGSVFAIVAGCGLLSVDYSKLVESSRFYVWEFGRWCYGNRTWDLAKNNFRRMML